MRPEARWQSLSERPEEPLAAELQSPEVAQSLLAVWRQQEAELALSAELRPPKAADKSLPQKRA